MVSFWVKISPVKQRVLLQLEPIQCIWRNLPCIRGQLLRASHWTKWVEGREDFISLRYCSSEIKRLQLTRRLSDRICSKRATDGNHTEEIWYDPDRNIFYLKYKTHCRMEVNNQLLVFLLFLPLVSQGGNDDQATWISRTWKSTIGAVSTWRPASWTLISAYFNCSSDKVMPVYLQPVRLTTSMAKLPQPQPISRTSWCFSILV